ncbi:hypothetical protein PHLGIDRAFT_384102 [Phlebiopsis gigantea 11061_1 CR5-6]|uniref:Uncharacterized protein n=1 Tax=Phlebiopsis gigantea (strain 11061_1 CR5-6) TaxID=745531 RepID=A0A0C3P925_PHLG1|nr:hypothetical protein PHLGIDRAFT_384102 [Phlebiopsis gigantea 11061_1 CR5-6]
MRRKLTVVGFGRPREQLLEVLPVLEIGLRRPLARGRAVYAGWLGGIHDQGGGKAEDLRGETGPMIAEIRGESARRRRWVAERVRVAECAGQTSALEAGVGAVVVVKVVVKEVGGRRGRRGVAAGIVGTSCRFGVECLSTAGPEPAGSFGRERRRRRPHGGVRRADRRARCRCRCRRGCKAGHSPCVPAHKPSAIQTPGDLITFRLQMRRS